MNFHRIPLVLSVLVAVFFILTSCQTKTSSTTDTNTLDTVAIQKGQAIFSQQCAACHNFRQDGIGPQLGGITATVSTEWIENFIKDPKEMIESGDERSHQLFEKFKTIMPPFANFSDEELHGIISFLGIGSFVVICVPVGTVRATAAAESRSGNEKGLAGDPK